MRHALILLLLGFFATVAQPVHAQGPFLGEIDLVGFNFCAHWLGTLRRPDHVDQSRILPCFLFWEPPMAVTAEQLLLFPTCVDAGWLAWGKARDLVNKSWVRWVGEENVTLLVSQLPQSHACGPG